jgi:molecular chaperone DnaJ
VRYSQGFFTVARTCPQCNGEGRIVTDPCKECKGQGLVERERSTSVKIPAGVDTGQRLRLSGEGEHGRRGGPTGDLYVVLQVKPHEHFQREGSTVYARLPIAYPQAVLGASLPVETIHGTSTLEVPAGTAQGREFRLRGQGIQRLDGNGKGDHVAVIEIEIPEAREMSEEELELLRKLAELSGKPVKEERTLVDRVKNLFG